MNNIVLTFVYIITHQFLLMGSILVFTFLNDLRYGRPKSTKPETTIRWSSYHELSDSSIILEKVAAASVGERSGSSARCT